MRYEKLPVTPSLEPFVKCYFVWEGESAEQMELM